MTKGEILKEKLEKYKEHTGYAQFSPAQKKSAGKSLCDALHSLPNSNNKEIMHDYYRNRKGYDNE
jgi:hypothetical protein